MLLVPSLLIGGPRARAAQPVYALAARIRAGYRPEISVRVNGADPFWCTLDSGAGGVFLLDKAIGEAADLHGTRRQRGFGAGPDSVVDEIVTDTALQVDKLLLPRQSIHLRSLSGDACILGTKLLDRFIVEIDYLTPEVRLFVAGGYSPPARAVKLPLMFDGSGRPMVAARLLLQPRDVAMADVLLDTAVADQVLSLSKAFSDQQQILKRVPKLISPPFKAESVGQIDLLATRIARLSFGPVGLDNPVVMLFRTATNGVL